MRFHRIKAGLFLPKTHGRLCVRGVTLVELIIVAVIIAVLATIAAPLYTGFQEKARGSEARGILTTTYRNYKIAVEENRTITDWTSITMDDPNSDPGTWFNYTLSPAVPEARAVRKADGSKYLWIDLDTGIITTSSHYK
jgi:prepilin-type N-terminal cleavage/methylation domain-containing protein